MLRSMTGYGAASGVFGEYALQLSLRAVNHRHLQVKVRLSSEFQGLEREVEKRIRARLARGSVSVSLAVERAGGAVPVRLDSALARTYVEELGALAGDLGMDGALDLDTLLGLPGVLVPKADADGEDSALGDVLFDSLERALEELVAMREEEGAALERDLKEHLAALSQIESQVSARAPKVVLEHRLALHERINQMTGDVAVSSSDLAREVAVLCDRLDITEELARLRSHCAQFERLMGSPRVPCDPVGRKLDFLCQELFREVNTIGAKCNDAQLAYLVVDAKTHAERLREQVQNVE